MTTHSILPCTIFIAHSTSHIITYLSPSNVTIVVNSEDIFSPESSSSSVNCSTVKVLNRSIVTNFMMSIILLLIVVEFDVIVPSFESVYNFSGNFIWFREQIPVNVLSTVWNSVTTFIKNNIVVVCEAVKEASQTDVTTGEV
jgi:hypothetical protein